MIYKVIARINRLYIDIEVLERSCAKMIDKEIRNIKVLEFEETISLTNFPFNVSFE